MISSRKLKPIAEVLFFAYLAYNTISVNFGIYIQYLAPILMIMAATASGLIGIRKWFRSPVFILIFLVGLSSICIQFVKFGLGYDSKYVGMYYDWLLVAFIVIPLADNERFLKRIAFIIAIVVAIQLPFSIASKGDIFRIRFVGGSTGFDNANDLAAWAGFSFIIFWRSFWNEKKNLIRFFYFMVAAILLIVSLLTVSRGTLLAIALAVAIILIGIPKNRRLLYMVFVAWVVTAFFLVPPLQTISQNYQSRLFEDTGRLSLLQSGWSELQQVPFWGYGGDNVMITIRTNEINSPHNPFLLIGLSSGFIPMVFFLLLWLVIFIRVIINQFGKGIQVDRLALLAYTFTICFLSNGLFTSIWVVATIFYVSQIRGRKLVTLQKEPVIRQSGLSNLIDYSDKSVV